MSNRREHDPFLFPEMSENPWSTISGNKDRKNGKGHSAGLTTLELCAGAGGQALGFEEAGIGHEGLLEINKFACSTLRINRPHWNVIEGDLNQFSGSSFKGVDIISGGLPCPPFSVAGKQLGKNDERNLFPALIRLVDEVQPRAVMIENVRGILDAVFFDYRQYVAVELRKLGYEAGWKLMNASDFVRRLVHGMGFRYRLHVAKLPGKPDLVFASRKKIIEIRGCFWHQHQGCIDAHIPKTRRDYWRPKLLRNVQRDSDNLIKLKALGFRVCELWECEVANQKALMKKLKRFLGC